MGLFSTLYFGTKVLGIDVNELREKAKTMVQDFATQIVSEIPPEKINDKIANVEITENITAEEQQRRDENLEALKGVLETAGGEEQSYANVIQAMEEAPEQWGEVTKGLDAETIAHMDEAIQNGESITFDVVKLAYGATTSAVDDFTEKYADSPEAGESQTEATNTADEITQSRANQAESVLGTIDMSDENTVQMGE